MADLQKQIDVLGAGQRVLHEQVSELAVEQHLMAEKLQEAIRIGFKGAVDETVDKLIEKAQQRAAEHTGRWLWGTLKAALTRWLVIGLIVLLTYKYLGSGAAGSVIDTVVNGGKK